MKLYILGISRIELYHNTVCSECLFAREKSFISNKMGAPSDVKILITFHFQFYFLPVENREMIWSEFDKLLVKRL